MFSKTSFCNYCHFKRQIQAQGQSYIQNQILPRIKHKTLSLVAALWAKKFKKKDTFFLQVYKWGSIALSLSNEKCSTVDLAWLIRMPISTSSYYLF